MTAAVSPSADFLSTFIIRRGSYLLKVFTPMAAGYIVLASGVDPVWLTKVEKGLLSTGTGTAESG